MTLVVARIHGDRISIAADTLISEHEKALPYRYMSLKSICLPGGICVSYCGSPQLAAKSFQNYHSSIESISSFHDIVCFFTEQSRLHNNDYIIAFSDPARLVTIRNGQRTNGVSKTHWIGDEAAYRRFREYECKHKDLYYQGRAVCAAVFADEKKDSPASNLYTIMSNVVKDSEITSVGGFVTVISNRDNYFRFSVYSDTLFDWPQNLPDTSIFNESEKYDLTSSGENSKFSISQISPGYYNLNAVAFYVLKGRLLFPLYQTRSMESACHVMTDVAPSSIQEALDSFWAFPFRALCLVVSSLENLPSPFPRQNPTDGMGIGFFVEANTFPKPAN